MTLHDKIANEMPPLSHLQCSVCGERVPISKAATSGFLRYGWPTHCGKTMRLVTQAEVAKESPKEPKP